MHDRRNDSFQFMQTFIWNVKWQYVGRTDLGTDGFELDNVGGNVFKILTTMKNNT